MLISYRNTVNRARNKNELAKSQLKKLNKQKKKLKKETVAAQKAHVILQQISAEVQEHVHAEIADIVSNCLKSIFPNPYEFKINFERKRGKTEAQLVFVRNGDETDPLTACGGGVVDVSSFALRIAAILLSRPEKRRILVLDEPFKFLSAEYREAARELLSRLSEDLDIQIIMVTHVDEYRLGKVVKL